MDVTQTGKGLHIRFDGPKNYDGSFINADLPCREKGAITKLQTNVLSGRYYVKINSGRKDEKEFLVKVDDLAKAFKKSPEFANADINLLKAKITDQLQSGVKIGYTGGDTITFLFENLTKDKDLR